MNNLQDILHYRARPFLVFQLLLSKGLDIGSYIRLTIRRYVINHEKIFYRVFHDAYYLGDVDALTNPLVMQLMYQIHDNIISHMKHNLQQVESIIQDCRQNPEYHNMEYVCDYFQTMINHLKQSQSQSQPQPHSQQRECEASSTLKSELSIPTAQDVLDCPTNLFLVMQLLLDKQQLDISIYIRHVFGNEESLYRILYDAYYLSKWDWVKDYTLQTIMMEMHTNVIYQFGSHLQKVEEELNDVIYDPDYHWSMVPNDFTGLLNHFNQHYPERDLSELFKDTMTVFELTG